MTSHRTTDRPSEQRVGVQLDLLDGRERAGASGGTGRGSPGRLEVLSGVVVGVPRGGGRAGGGPVHLEMACSGKRCRVKGDPGPVQVGDRVRIPGRWVKGRRGEQWFEALAFAIPFPETPEVLERYLASSWVSGVGAGIARRLVEALGPALWDVLDRGESRRLARVPGVGEARARRILEAWHRDCLEREARLFLLGLGLGPDLVDRIVLHHGRNTVAMVVDAPYRLAREVPGIGFHRADRIARAISPAPDPVARACEAVIHVLEQAVEAGHVCVPLEEIMPRAQALGVLPADVLRAQVRLADRGRIRIEEVGEGVEKQRVAYLESLYAAESRVVEGLVARVDRQDQGIPWRADVDLARIESVLGLVLEGRQREAVKAVMAAPLVVVTGGPGTGKTTIVRAMVALAHQAGIRMILAAPTGRAAQRLREATGQEARTVHRWLEVQPVSGRFGRNRHKPLDADILLVDEASMIDLFLFAAILDALRSDTTLVLVGDADQLPPVGPGRILASIVASGLFRVVSLDRVFRQAAGSMIPFNARRIMTGRMPILARGREAEGADFFFLPAQDEEQAARLVVEIVVERLPRRYGLDPMTDILVLSPTYRGPAGVDALNSALQARLNPGVRPDSARLGRFSNGDKVLQSRNNYDLELFNGDVGRILEVTPRWLRVDFGGRRVTLSRRDARDLELAYAVTVHKAQGSEARAVVMPVVGDQHGLLRRELIYTAVTRARALVVLVGDRRALARALAREAREDRIDLLPRRLQARVGRPGGYPGVVGRVGKR